MNTEKKKPGLKRVLVALGIGAAMFAAMMAWRGGFTAADPAARWQCISDAFFVPGILLAAFGLLVWVADGGAFDALKFMVQKLFIIILSDEKRAKYPKTFYDYKVQQEAKERAPVSHLLWIGLGFIAAAGVALYVYSRYAPLT